MKMFNVAVVDKAEGQCTLLNALAVKPYIYFINNNNNNNFINTADNKNNNSNRFNRR